MIQEAARQFLAYYFSSVHAVYRGEEPTPELVAQLESMRDTLLKTYRLQMSANSMWFKNPMSSALLSDGNFVNKLICSFDEDPELRVLIEEEVLKPAYAEAILDTLWETTAAQYESLNEAAENVLYEYENE